MTWDDRILTDRELREFLRPETTPPLAGLVEALVGYHKQAWPMLRDGYHAMERAALKRVDVDGSFVLVQHNPGRIRSTAARVDKESVAARDCFLCPDRLPPEEKGIAYGEEFILLCNPLPVLEQHLSVVHRDHVAQSIWNNFEVLLQLAFDLGRDYIALYNGPECGASAPDHLHFQVCRRSSLPIESALRATEEPPAETCDICDRQPRDDFELLTLGDGGRAAIVFQATIAQRLSTWLYETLGELARRSQRSEPMVNLLCTHDGKKWTAVLFPRVRHRPTCFYEDAPNQILISPGAIDMAGVLVVPHREHFERIGPDDVQTIFGEVSMAENEVNDVVERVCERAGIVE